MADHRPRGRRERDGMEREFDQRIIDIARVTRVMAGGKRMRFRACVVIGDRKGRLGFGIGKGADVTLAVNKAVNNAKKELIAVPAQNGTIPHEARIKYKASRLMLKPAPKGTGVVAGGAVRMALELSNIDNVVAKIYGSKNKLNNIKALFSALRELSSSVNRQKMLRRTKEEPATANLEPVT
ncbi:30S ribosomal protein S5 [Candidatus Uhrbacteria bacterium]|nr:30S ribosomal protein S5 [Candidatus Uhrbacteria bacterium]